MDASVRHRPDRRKRRIRRRPEDEPGVERPEPKSAASDIHHEPSDRARVIAPGEAITVNGNGEPGRRKEVWFDVVKETEE